MRLLVLVPPGDDPEAWGAVAWAGRMGLEVRAVHLDRAQAPPVIAPDEVPWCHAAAAVPSLPAAWGDALGGWLRDGGRMLLTVLAAPLAAALGAPGPPPVVEGPRRWRHDDDPLWPPDFRDWPDYPHRRGMHGWGVHPLFAGLGRGTYTWTATEGEWVARCSFHRPVWPTGRVLAVERAYVALHANEAVAWTYDVGAGHLLCLGANISLAAADASLAPQRDRVLLNALALLDRGSAWRAEPEDAWPPPLRDPDEALTRHVGAVTVVQPPALAPLSALPPSPLVMTGPVRPDAPFTMAGRRALVVGSEARGVQEIWLHPLGVLSEGLRLRVDDADVTPLEVRVTPQAVQRIVRDARGRQWREVVAVSPEAALARYDIAPVDPAPGAVATLSASLRLRLQWPMPSDGVWPLLVRHGQDGARAVICIGAARGPLEVRCAADGVGAMVVGAGIGVVAVTLSSVAGAGLRLAIVGHIAGAAALAPAWRELAHETMEEMLGRLARRDAQRARATVQLTTPEPHLDVAFEWAKARLDAFFVSVAAVGTGMTAGYAASQPGWGDARPGYGWFFGRDACWCGDALLAAGLFDAARLAVEFLAAHADVTGKIAHEVTTSGVAHYDAADATPLWLRFVARYAEWTGDLATVRGVHAQIVRAVDFVISTDRDGDGLPDNTGVGHGWIESGPLGGGALTSYTASIWIDALRRLHPVAERLADSELAERVHAALSRAEGAFERRLRDPLTGRVLLQRRTVPSPAAGNEGRETSRAAAASAAAAAAAADGAAGDAREEAACDVADDDLTALAAVPILLGVDRHATADEVVARLADDDFDTPWGVRLLSRRDARYRPRGYHVGAVWPLYTGWASLASFVRARPALGWRHLRAVADAAFHRERGAFDEVLDGDTGEGAGICPDQAWSAAMVITPFVDGMLGLSPLAFEGRCRLAPQWPAAWGEARIRGLRVGRSVFSFTMRRAGAMLHYRFVLEEGPPLEVQLAGAGDAPGTLAPGVPVSVTRAAAGGDDVRG